MNRIIEADFFPRESNLEFSWRGPTPNTFGAKEKRRILIVDNDRDSTHLVKILSRKDRLVFRARRERRYQGSSKRPEF